MEYNGEARVQCLLVYSKYPPHLRSVMSMLHATASTLKRVYIAPGAQMSLYPRSWFR